MADYNMVLLRGQDLYAAATAEDATAEDYVAQLHDPRPLHANTIAVAEDKVDDDYDASLQAPING